MYTKALSILLALLIIGGIIFIPYFSGYYFLKIIDPSCLVGTNILLEILGRYFAGILLLMALCLVLGVIYCILVGFYKLYIIIFDKLPDIDEFLEKKRKRKIVKKEKLKKQNGQISLYKDNKLRGNLSLED